MDIRKLLTDPATRREAHRRLRNIGLAPFGFVQEDFRHHHQLLRVWELGSLPRWEVWAWPVNTGSSGVDDAYRSDNACDDARAQYATIQERARLVWAGRNWAEARATFAGPEGPRPATAPWRSRMLCPHERARFHAATGSELVGDGHSVTVGVLYRCPDCGFDAKGDVRSGMPRPAPLFEAIERLRGCYMLTDAGRTLTEEATSLQESEAPPAADRLKIATWRLTIIASGLAALWEAAEMVYGPGVEGVTACTKRKGAKVRFRADGTGAVAAGKVGTVVGVPSAEWFMVRVDDHPERVVLHVTAKCVDWLC